MTALPIAFMQPLILAALLALPVIWWLLRFTPPRPQRLQFPATRILLGLEKREETRAQSPWWLTALRILIAALVILALARPILNPNPVALSGAGPVALVIDDGWASAKSWDRIRDMAETVIAAVDEADRPVFLTGTARSEATATPLAMTADEAADILTTLAPQPIAPDRDGALDALVQAAADQPPGDIYWLTDGLAHGEDGFPARLSAAFPEATIHAVTADGDNLPVVLAAPQPGSGTLTLDLVGLDAAAVPETRVVALDQRGRAIAEVTPDAGDDGGHRAAFDLPVELRNEIVRVEILGEATAGAVQLLDDRFRRKTVGLVSGGSPNRAQPLLSPLHYIDRALDPFADLREPRTDAVAASIDQMTTEGVSVMVFADIGTLSPTAGTQVADWLAEGGVLIRFAGPRLAAADDPLVPVRLRRGERSLGGALSWTEPQRLAEFPDEGPFAGLRAPRDVLVTRQVLAEPEIDLAEKTWATLEDGTPLVTAQRMGQGWLVLFHVTADSSWSNLPISGVFVEMLRALIDLGAAPGAAGTTTADEAGSAAEADRGVLRPYRALDGYGRLAAPPLTAEPIAAADFASTTPTAIHPPGLYGSEGAFRALSLFGPDPEIEPLDLSGANVQTLAYPTDDPRALGPFLLVAAIFLLALDSIAILMLSGLRPRFARAPQQTMAIAGLVALTSLAFSAGAVAQETDPTADQFALDATLETRLAYVRTGDRELDATSRQGLIGLSEVLAQRTSLEPGAPVAVDLIRDELAFFPLIYWPVTAESEMPSAEELDRIDGFMRRGGTVLFDTGDQLLAGTNWANSTGPGMQRLRLMLAGLDIPPIEPVPADHVLTKAFYLLQDFPGRYSGGALWVEATERDPDAPPRPVYNADGVSSIMITSNDLAGAWAIDGSGSPINAVTPGGELQREMAYRVGVNIVMYALTGNYKADQVHIPALLERLGQ